MKRFFNVLADFSDGKAQYYAGERVDCARFDTEKVWGYIMFGWLAYERVGVPCEQAGVTA